MRSARLADEFTHPDPVFIERVFRNTDGAAVWCDVIQSVAGRNLHRYRPRGAGRGAAAACRNTTGRTSKAGAGAMRIRRRMTTPVLGNVPVLRYFVNIRQSTSGGDNTLMRGRTKGTEPDPFLNVHGAGYRGVYDFADPDSSVFILATGQSGHPLSRHYDDLGELWRRGEYIPMSLDPELARAAAVGITRLVPQ